MLRRLLTEHRNSTRSEITKNFTLILKKIVKKLKWASSTTITSFLYYSQNRETPKDKKNCDKNFRNDSNYDMLA